MPPPTDVFRPRPGDSYSKGQVNRAGKLIHKFWYTPPADESDPLAGWDVNALVDALYAIEWWRQLHAAPLSRVAATLRHHVRKEGGLVGGRIDVTQRLKKRGTMISKLDRESTMELTQMYDVGGVRARLPTLEHVHAVSRRLKKTWTITKTKDYVAEPKDSGYRAIHHVVKNSGRLIEVQLRTIRQDAWANQVEDESRVQLIGYKFGTGPLDVRGYYECAARVFELMDRGQPIPDELRNELNERHTVVREKLSRRRNGGT